MFIFREEIYDPKPENAGQAEIIVAKHRSGPTGRRAARVPPAVHPLRQHGPRVRLSLVRCCSSSGSGSRSPGARSPSRSAGGSGARPWPAAATAPLAGSSRSMPSTSSTESAITEADARAGLYPSAAALVADLRGTPDLDLYRIRFHTVDEPGPAGGARRVRRPRRRRPRASSTRRLGSARSGQPARRRGRCATLRADRAPPGRAGRRPGRRARPRAAPVQDRRAQAEEPRASRSASTWATGSARVARPTSGTGAAGLDRAGQRPSAAAGDVRPGPPASRRSAPRCARRRGRPPPPGRAARRPRSWRRRLDAEAGGEGGDPVGGGAGIVGHGGDRTLGPWRRNRVSCGCRPTLVIPLAELAWRFSRSGGPGWPARQHRRHPGRGPLRHRRVALARPAPAGPPARAARARRCGWSPPTSGRRPATGTWPCGAWPTGCARRCGSRRRGGPPGPRGPACSGGSRTSAARPIARQTAGARRPTDARRGRPVRPLGVRSVLQFA